MKQLDLNLDVREEPVRWWRKPENNRVIYDPEVAAVLAEFYPWQRASEITDLEWSKYQPTIGNRVPQQAAYALSMPETIDWADSICTQNGIRFGDWGESLCVDIANGDYPWWVKIENTTYAEIAISTLALYGLIRTPTITGRSGLSPSIRDRPLDDVLSLRMWTGSYFDGAPLIYRWWHYALDSNESVQPRKVPNGKSMMDLMMERSDGER